MSLRSPALHRQDLHEGWTLTVTDGPVPFPVTDLPATVPGTFLTDLLDAGLIPDPYLDEHEKDLAWSGECDLVYRTVFTVQEPRERVDLVARSLDTVATVVLNGHEVAVTRNQHRSWRWRVEHLLVEGANTLEIRFASPLRAAREDAAAQGDLPFIGNPHPYNALRKMACNFGWDWGPVLVTSGIAGPLGLESWDGARLGTTRPRVELEGDDGRVTVHVPVERTGDAGDLALRLRVTDPDGEEVALLHRDLAAQDATDLQVRVPAVRRWWPRGYGEQPLYTVTVALLDAEGSLLDETARRVGFRTAGFEERADEIGTSFTLVVNDRPILVKGANWIPDDCFPTRLTAGHYRRGVEHALEAGMNMLRIWGGGLYESDLLYNLCDEEGVLVWQDFALACAAYSEQEPLRSEIEAEARENIVRLAWHPSLVHWNGSNENVEGYYHWGFREIIREGVGWGNGYYTQLLPGLLEELDPTRSFTPSSPYSRPLVHEPRHPDHGTVHNWVVWADEHDNDYTHYRDTSPRFAAEFGFQGPATLATVRRAITERPLRADSPAMLSHQKAARGQEKLVAGYRPHFPDPDPGSFEDFHLTTSLNQARALQVGIGHYRALWPRCGGTIIWQLNDCWPVTSWSAVDGDGRRKLLWYAMRDLYRPVLLTVQPAGPASPRPLELVASLGNDTDAPVEGELSLRRLTLTGEELAAARIPVSTPARSTATVPVPAELATAQDPTRELLAVELLPSTAPADAPTADATAAGAAGSAPVLDATADRIRTVHWFAEDIDLALDPAALAASARAEGEDVVLDLEARGAVRDVCVLADAVHPDAVADRQLVTLLPGERASVRVRVPGGAGAVGGPEALLAPDVLRHVGELLARSRRAVVA